VILEGFEIENWSCIKRVAASDLPPTGVIVFSGPNGIGKSSIVEALRACLMDYKSTATAKSLGRGFPKNSSEKPRVCVTFRANGATWRITKQFGSKESKLESRASAGSPWKLETSDATDAHERTRQLCGSTDSNFGLYQLLWLTQAEFKLPESKKFDEDVKSQLRSVLGVLQTALDNHFIGRVKEEWSRWFTARSKPGERPKPKTTCSLVKARDELAKENEELRKVEEEFKSYEGMALRSEGLEIEAMELRRSLGREMEIRGRVQEEYEKSQGRVEAHKHAITRFEAAETAVAVAEALRVKRREAEQNVQDAERAVGTAKRDSNEKSRLLDVAEELLRTLRGQIEEKRTAGESLQNTLNSVTEQKGLLALRLQVTAAQDERTRAETLAADIEEWTRHARDNPVPAAATLEKFEENRKKAGKLRAELDAAAISLELHPDSSAPAASLRLDGAPAERIDRSANPGPVRRPVRRSAELAIPNWGRIELIRGSDSRDLDTSESELRDLDNSYAKALEPFGLAALDPTSLDQLRNRSIAKGLRDPELKRKQQDLDKLAPRGLAALRDRVAGLEQLLRAKELGITETMLDEADLDRESARLSTEIETNNTSIQSLQGKIDELTSEIEGSTESAGPSRRGKGEKVALAPSGLRLQAEAAKLLHASLEATVAIRKEEEGRVPTTEQIDAKAKAADVSLETAKAEREATALSDAEATIAVRLQAAKDAVQAVEKRLKEVESTRLELRGHLRASEGLHQRRAAAMVRVEELTRATERETLESDAYDRLYALFEECRDKRLDVVMKPIADRVVQWMRLLNIGGYHSIRFNDQCLPETLSTPGGAVELALDEESTGTIEQIALMVRLGLGSILSKGSEPVAAVLDDPLTHGDVVRLNRMRAVLRSAAAGESASDPPAGPLQILVFTCHPERFEMDGASSINLSNPSVMSRITW
jgi:AAA domain